MARAAKARAFVLTAPEPVEDDIQAGVVSMLKIALPEAVEWTHFPAGFLKTKDPLSAILNLQRLTKLGFKKGRPDLQFVYAGRIYYIEMKTRLGTLGDEQEKFRDWCLKYETPWALCRSAKEVYDALVKWQLPVRYIVF